MKVGVVVLSWNSVAVIDDCLGGLVRYLDQPVYLVDNGSADDTVAVVRERYPGVQVIEVGANFGFAGGNNIGIRRALADGCDAVLLLNDDTVIDEDFLTPLLAAIRERPEIGVAGPVIVDADRPTRVQFAGGSINLWSLTFPYRGRGTDYRRENMLEATDYVLGAAMLIRRSVIETLGGLDEEYYPAYVEEADFCHRAALAGYRVAMFHGSRVRHIGGMSAGGTANQVRRMMAHRFLFGLKHLHPLQFLVAAQVVLMHAFVRKLRTSLA
jgi:hypothetical protein